jgi:hypothetical protein
MRRSRWTILVAIVLILGGGLLLAQNLNLVGPLQLPTASFILGGLGLLFLLVFITAPSDDWWAAIPGCVLLGVGVVTYLESLPVRIEWGGSVVLFSVGLPFLLIYLVKRGSFGWALIPGGIMTTLAVITILSLGVPEEIVGTLVLWAIALAFWIVYLVNRRNWWAIIPAGTLTVLGLMPLLSLSDLPVQLIGGVFFVGLSAVFGLIYLLNRRDPQMFWPVYPAAVLFAIGIGVSVFGQNWWPLVLVALGVFLLVRAVLPRSR